VRLPEFEIPGLLLGEVFDVGNGPLDGLAAPLIGGGVEDGCQLVDEPGNGMSGRLTLGLDLGKITVVGVRAADRVAVAYAGGHHNAAPVCSHRMSLSVEESGTLGIVIRMVSAPSGNANESDARPLQTMNAPGVPRLPNSSMGSETPYRSALPRRPIRRRKGRTIGAPHRPRWSVADASAGLELDHETADWRIIRHDDWRDIRHLAPRRFDWGRTSTATEEPHRPYGDPRRCALQQAFDRLDEMARVDAGRGHELRGRARAGHVADS
jgi:hypothetical protein